VRVFLQSFRRNCRQESVRGRWTCWPVAGCVYIYLCVCICIYIYKVTWTCLLASKFSCEVFQSFRRNCKQVAVRGRWTCWRVSVCVFICIYIYIINMYLQLWAHMCSEILVRGNCNHFSVTADKGPGVFDGLAGLSLCVCVYVYIYMCVCLYLYIYIY
jgi:hypothetical protein